MGARAASPASSTCSVEFEVALGDESDDVEQARLIGVGRVANNAKASERQEQWRDHERRTR